MRARNSMVLRSGSRRNTDTCPSPNVTGPWVMVMSFFFSVAMVVLMFLFLELFLILGMKLNLEMILKKL